MTCVALFEKLLYDGIRFDDRTEKVGLFFLKKGVFVVENIRVGFLGPSAVGRSDIVRLEGDQEVIRDIRPCAEECSAGTEHRGFRHHYGQPSSPPPFLVHTVAINRVSVKKLLISDNKNVNAMSIGLIVDDHTVVDDFADKIGDSAMIRMFRVNLKIILVLEYGVEHNMIGRRVFDYINADLDMPDLRNGFFQGLQLDLDSFRVSSSVRPFGKVLKLPHHHMFYHEQ